MRGYSLVNWLVRRIVFLKAVQRLLLHFKERHVEMLFGAVTGDLDQFGLSRSQFLTRDVVFPGCVKISTEAGHELLFLRCDDKSARDKSLSFLSRAKSYAVLYSSSGELLKVWRFDR